MYRPRRDLVSHHTDVCCCSDLNFRSISLPGFKNTGRDVRLIMSDTRDLLGPAAQPDAFVWQRRMERKDPFGPDRLYCELLLHAPAELPASVPHTYISWSTETGLERADKRLHLRLFHFPNRRWLQRPLSFTVRGEELWMRNGRELHSGSQLCQNVK